MPAPCSRRRMVEELIVDGSIGSLNCAETSVSGATPVAFASGSRPTIVGGVASAPAL